VLGLGASNDCLTLGPRVKVSARHRRRGRSTRPGRRRTRGARAADRRQRSRTRAADRADEAATRPAAPKSVPLEPARGSDEQVAHDGDRGGRVVKERAAFGYGGARGVTPDARSGSGPARDGSASVTTGSAAGSVLDERGRPGRPVLRGGGPPPRRLRLQPRN
jgi:hypothetical protein